jgi:hypothetical protein
LTSIQPFLKLAIFQEKEKLKTKKSKMEVILEVFSRQSEGKIKVKKREI